ncbi:hypothetical protein [Serratia marcescens]|uniref:hypothetical protein n=1 Tax=Serratia marcescens TaxID=615 RepID=UPI0006ED292F|nr:hypothetical protein [Serratia marcescens]ALL37834.1 hypothetical protein AR325_13000 [Serratia marcescens]PHI48417.1 hypothetical protein B9T65_14460 [Serratia marcescens]UJA56302.1 hypothetical protein L1F17_10545 [Serratia marcescens]
MGKVIEKQKSHEECMNDFFGEEVNKHFANYLVELFGPTISRVAEDYVLRGKPKADVLSAVTTTAEAMVVGMRAVLNCVNSSPEHQQQPYGAPKGNIQEDQQTGT